MQPSVLRRQHRNGTSFLGSPARGTIGPLDRQVDGCPRSSGVQEIGRSQGKPGVAGMSADPHRHEGVAAGPDEVVVGADAGIEQQLTHEPDDDAQRVVADRRRHGRGTAQPIGGAATIDLPGRG